MTGATSWCNPSEFNEVTARNRVGLHVTRGQAAPFFLTLAANKISRIVSFLFFQKPSPSQIIRQVFCRHTIEPDHPAFKSAHVGI